MLASLATIFGGITAAFGLFKLGVWLFQKTSEAKKEQIDQEVANTEEKTVETGRP